MFRLPSYLFLTSFYLVLIAIHNLKDKNKYSPWTDHISNFLLILAKFRTYFKKLWREREGRPMAFMVAILLSFLARSLSGKLFNMKFIIK